ncbi:MAG TPA: HAD-IA family hydrolase [Myxococcota bacterium]|nr:HAD-IA family hydrolase [Myxococcota bacterium]
MLRAVLFDATGTLIELAEPVGETYARAAACHGAAISAWRLADAFARVLRGAAPPDYTEARGPVDALERAWWRERVREVFLAADSAVRVRNFDACFADLWRHFGRGEAWRSRPGAEEALGALREAGLATAVVSNFDSRLRDVLTDLGLAPRLSAIVLASDARARKPDPALLRLALERLGCRPAEAALVGDDPARDLEPARRLGLVAVDARELATLAALPARLRALTRAPADLQETR